MELRLAWYETMLVIEMRRFLLQVVLPYIERFVGAALDSVGKGLLADTYTPPRSTQRRTKGR
jgi:hypothetical protein